MLALQYAHRLPADYPMATIHERIAARGPLWDMTPGLVFKAFATRTRGVAGAEGNVYSSVYLWRDAGAASAFLCDDRFAAVSGTFGRPRVETLLPLVARTTGDGTGVVSLTREDVVLGPDADVRRRREAEEARAADEIAGPDVAGFVSALDVQDWRLVRYRLFSTPVAATDRGIAYAIGHLARPGWSHVTSERT